MIQINREREREMKRKNDRRDGKKEKDQAKGGKKRKTLNEKEE